jgi:hypothetical protein
MVASTKELTPDHGVEVFSVMTTTWVILTLDIGRLAIANLPLLNARCHIK